MSQNDFRIFLCHSSEDKAAVNALYKRLSEDGISMWLDAENLLPGQDWDLEIKKAIKESAIVLVCLSRNSITKEGYVQKEIKLALDMAGEKPEGTIYVIPTRLEECEIPTRLSNLQWVNMFQENGYKKLKVAIQEREKELIIKRNQSNQISDELIYICDKCGKAIDYKENRGRIYLPYNEYKLAEQIKEEEDLPHDNLEWLTLETMMHSKAYWYKAHYVCSEDEEDWYSFDINRAKHLSDLQEWDMHLSEKKWLPLTNWSNFVLNIINEQKNLGR